MTTLVKKKKYLPGVIFSIIMAAFVMTGCATFQAIDSPYSATSKNEVRELMNSERWDYRLQGISHASLYGATGDKEFAEKIFLQGTRDTHRPIVMQSISELAAIGSIEGEQRIIELLGEKKDKDIIWHCLKALGQYKNSANGAIFASFMSSPDWLHREAAMIGILSIADLNEQYRLVPVIIAGINDTNTTVSIKTLLHLEIKDERLYRAITEKIDQIEDSKTEYLTALLTALTGYVLDGKTREHVIDYLAHSNVAIRLKAFHVLKAEQDLMKTKKSAY